MKKTILLALSATICLVFGTINKLHSMIYFQHNFDNTPSGDFEYLYDNWNDTNNTTINYGTSFVTIYSTGSGPGNSYGTNGGGGWNVSVDATLTPPANTYIVITAQVLSNHNGTTISVALATDINNYTVWWAPASLFTSLNTVYIPLTNPSWSPSGLGQGPVNLASIANINVQGDYSSSSDFHFEVHYVALIPESQQAALAIFLGLGCAIAVARKKFTSPTTA